MKRGNWIPWHKSGSAVLLPEGGEVVVVGGGGDLGEGWQSSCIVRFEGFVVQLVATDGAQR